MSNHPNSAEVAIPWWWRPALVIAGVIVGLVLMGLGVQLGDWFLNHSDGVESSVSCDDDYYYEEDEFEVEQFENEAGVWCQRTTEEVSHSLTHGWPLGLAAPVWVIALAVVAVLSIGGLIGAIIWVFLMCDEDTGDSLREQRAAQLAAKKR